MRQESRWGPPSDGVDIIAYGSKLSHLYVPGGGAAGLTVVGGTAAAP